MAVIFLNRKSRHSPPDPMDDLEQLAPPSLGLQLREGPTAAADWLLSQACLSFSSRADGIVSWQRCTSLPAHETENVEVQGAHIGLGCSLETLYVAADRLAQPEGRLAAEGKTFN